MVTFLFFALYVKRILLAKSDDTLEHFFDVGFAERYDCRSAVRTFGRQIAVFVNVILYHAFDLCS